MARWREFADWVVPAPGSRVLQLGCSIAVLILTYVVIDRWTGELGELPGEAYEGPFIAAAMIPNLASPRTALPLLVLAGLLLWRRGRIRWTEIESGGAVRAFVLLLVGVLAWTYSTYDENLYFGRLHGGDRALLLAFALLTAWRPLFVLPFVVLVIPVIQQFLVPIRGFSLVDPFLLVRVLLLFCATLLLLLLTGSRSAYGFVFGTLVLIASSYWACGLGKLELGWLTHGHIENVFPGAHVNGWLGFLESDTVSAVTRAASWFDWPMRIGTILVECGALLILVHRRAALALLGGWILFHAGVFALTGICFWKWSLVDGALLAYFASRKRAQRFPVFGRAGFAISLVLILGSSFWLKPVKLAWYDARMSYGYRFEATTADGERLNLPARFFAPYEYQFAMGGFGYLDQEPSLAIVMGAIFDREEAEALMEADSPERLLALERELGSVRYGPKRAEHFDRFMARFVRSVNTRGRRYSWTRFLRAPPLLWTSPIEPVFTGEGSPVRHVDVVQVTADWDGERYREIRRRTVRSVKIPR